VRASRDWLGLAAIFASAQTIRQLHACGTAL
jgi:hypothetical protein